MISGIRINRLIVCVTAALLLALAWGCSDGKMVNPLEGERVMADVDLAGEMTSVEASSNAHCKMGVKHLRAENWSGAAEEFEAALADDPKDWRAAYGLGVAHEKRERYADALRAYEQANLNVKGAGNSDITAAILRTKEKAR
jgi:Tfp pilus assembly protein PilF